MKSEHPSLSDITTSLIKKLTGHTVLEDIIWILAEHVTMALDAPDCIIYLVDESSKYLVQRAADGPKSPASGVIHSPIKLKIGQGVVGRAAKTLEIQRIADTAKDPDYIQDSFAGHSELAVPVIFDNKVVGVIDSEHPEKNYYTERHAIQTGVIAAITAAFIVNSRMTEQLRTLTRKLEWEASHDILTGLKNRRTLDSSYQTILRHTPFKPFSLVFMDINRFKSINDQWGHTHGDQLLTLTGKILRDSLNGFEHIFRIGGDEFCVLLPVDDRKAVLALCNKVQMTTLKRINHLIKERKQAFFSIGICEVSKPSVNLSQALNMADAASYHSKRTPNQSVTRFDEIRH